MTPRLRIPALARKRVRAAFTLVELLVVVAVVGVLVGLLLPMVLDAIEAARVVAAKADLRTIGDALEKYAKDHHRQYPPTRTYCNADQWQYSNHLPNELADEGWVPRDRGSIGLYCNVRDPFNGGCSYKYLRPGWGVHNGAAVPKDIWVPDSFPSDPFDSHVPGRWYDDLSRPLDVGGQLVRSPVKWVVWSVGPGFEPHLPPCPHGPVARECWYHGIGTRGIIPRIGIREGPVVFGP